MQIKEAKMLLLPQDDMKKWQLFLFQKFFLCNIYLQQLDLKDYFVFDIKISQTLNIIF